MTNLRDNVKAFHEAMDMDDPLRPVVPSDDVVMLRARLITEEYFETMRALFVMSHVDGRIFSAAESSVLELIEMFTPGVNLTELADGLADLMYVCEGSFLAFGINSAPIHAEVQRANMAKIGGPIREDGKRLKPAGWTPPDIAGAIAAQHA